MPAFSAPLDLRKNELRNAVTQNLGTAPPSPVPGLRYYDTISNLENFWDGTKWVALTDVVDASNVTGLGDLALLDQVGAAEITPGSIDDSHISATAAIALSKLAVDPLDRANHTGTQLAATISDFDTQVRTNPLDLMAPPSGPVSMAGQTITNLGNPALASDAVNKAYVDNVSAGLDVKHSVRVATDTDLNLFSPGTSLDGITMNVGDRILVMAQTDGVQNGLYSYTGDATPMTRCTDADTDDEVNSGLFTFVEEGSHADQGWVLVTDNPISVGITSLAFSQFSGTGAVIGTPDRITVTGNQVDIAATYTGQASLTTLGTITTGVWQGTPIDILYGGTGATTAQQARLNLGTLGKYPTIIGNGSDVSFTLYHGLNTIEVGVELFEVSTGQTVYADVRRLDANNVVIDGFGTAPAASSLGVVIWG
jgi:hypothetical protein